MVSYVITAYILAFCLSVTIDVARCAFECQKATPLKIYTIMTSKSNDRFGFIKYPIGHPAARFLASVMVKTQ